MSGLPELIRPIAQAVAGLSLISVLVELTLPKGKMKAAAHFALGLLMMLTLIDPVVSALKGAEALADGARNSLARSGAEAAIAAFASHGEIAGSRWRLTAEAVAERAALQGGATEARAQAVLTGDGDLTGISVRCDLPEARRAELRLEIARLLGVDVDLIVIE